MKSCPYCDREMESHETICPNCGEEWVVEEVAAIKNDLDKFDKMLNYQAFSTQRENERKQELEAKEQKENRIRMSQRSDLAHRAKRPLTHSRFELRRKKHYSPISPGHTYDLSKMILALILNLFPPLFLVSHYLVDSNYRKETEFWIKNGERFKRGVLYYINRFLTTFWSILFTLLIIAVILALFGVFGDIDSAYYLSRIVARVNAFM